MQCYKIILKKFFIIKICNYDTETKFNYGNKFITLSTCEYSQDNGRMIVIGVKI